MANKLRIKRRASGAPGAPSSLENSELAFNEVDNTLYYGKGTGGTGGTATTIEAIAGAVKADINSPSFTGAPTAPTPAGGANNTQLATTAFVQAAVTAGSVADGDKGDITVSGGGASWAIDSGAVTNAKLAAVATGTIKGRTAAGSGAVEDLTGAQAKTLIGLGNADNTSDATKPVSTPQLAALNLKINSAEKGAANGVATLDAGSKIPVSQLPSIAISETSVVATQAAMLALTAQTGDVAIRTDINKTFILSAEPATVLGNWKELLNPTSPVSSVFGRTGAITAAVGDYTVAQVTGAAPIASPTFTGVPAAPTAVVATNTTQLATTAFVQANKALGLLKANNLSDVANVAVSRDNLGLGTMATQNAAAVAITGGTIDGITIDGGTF